MKKKNQKKNKKKKNKKQKKKKSIELYENLKTKITPAEARKRSRSAQVCKFIRVSYTKSYFHRNGNRILYRAKKFKDECRFPNFDFPSGSVFLGGKTIAVSI